MAVREFRQVGKPPELIQKLEKLWGQDKLVEARLRRAKIVFIISCILLVILIIVGSATGNFWALLLIVPAIVVSAGLWWYYHRLNLDDRRILTPLKLLEVLQADIAPRDPVRLVVSFADYRKHGRKISSEGRRARYEDTWLEAEGWLAEKTRFRLVVSQTISLTSTRKRKYTKRKERIREAVGIHLQPNRKIYQALDRFPAQFSAGEKVAGLRLESARATRRGVLLVAEGDLYTKISGRSTQETGTENLIQGDKLLMLLTAVYDRLNRCK